MLTELVKFLQWQDKTGHVSASMADPMLVPSDMKLRSLEDLSLHRYRERMKANTPSIDAYIGYVNRRAADRTDVVSMVDPDHCVAKTIFNTTDDGQPGHCDDIARCTLRSLPMYAFLQKIGEADAMTLSQRDLLDMIRDWHEHIEGVPALVQAFSKLNVEALSKNSSEEKDFGRERSAMEKIDLKADGGEVPSEIPVTFVPYEGFTERQVAISVSALVTREDVRIRLRVRGYESLKLAIATEFAGRLSEALDVSPFIGMIEAA